VAVCFVAGALTQVGTSTLLLCVRQQRTRFRFRSYGIVRKMLFESNDRQHCWPGALKAVEDSNLHNRAAT